jgi:hypothetical protein
MPTQYCHLYLYLCLLRPGVVVAVRGQAPPGGDFVVSEVLAADLPHQMPLPAPVAAAVVREEGAAAAAAAALPSDKYVALVSGLQLASSKADHLQVRLWGASRGCSIKPPLPIILKPFLPSQRCCPTPTL